MTITSIDLFAGGGGASKGIELATGKSPVIAVNHDDEALKMHAANHPGTMHLCENVLDVDPIAPNGRLDLLWASPDCTFFSRARGGKPMKKEIRALPNVVITWARYAQPSVICMENVKEIQDWGPLYPSDHPDPKKRDRPIPERRSEDWKKFIRALRDCGYDVEWRVLCAADYGAPTTRDRLFLIARSDGQSIVWPEPTHGPGRPMPHLPAAGCIDWDIPCPSIFMSPTEAKQWAADRRKATGQRIGTPRRPLKPKTMARIAEGMRRYVLESSNPFLLNLTHGGRLEPLHDPFKTITGANRGEKALITPYFATLDHQSSSDRSCVMPPDDPLSTITSKNRHMLLTPMLIQTRNGERPGQTPRTLDIRKPLNTITSQGSQGALVTALLQSTHSNPVYRSPRDPLATITASAGGHQSLISAFLVKYYGQGVGQSIADPLHTITNRARFGMVQAFLTELVGASNGLITTTIAGTEYVVADIGMRMLTPRELARAQGFPDDYILTGNKSTQIAKIGNSVPPPVVEAIVRAQFRADPHQIKLQAVA